MTWVLHKKNEPPVDGVWLNSIVIDANEDGAFINWTHNGVSHIIPLSVFEEPSSVMLGETSLTAYRGDRGKSAYDFSQARPTTNEVNLGLDDTKPITAKKLADSNYAKVNDILVANEVADETERLALTGLIRGARVYQIDNTYWYELMNPLSPNTVESWQVIPKELVVNYCIATGVATFVVVKNTCGGIVDVNVVGDGVIEIEVADFTFLSIGKTSIIATSHADDSATIQGQPIGYVLDGDVYIYNFNIDSSPALIVGDGLNHWASVHIITSP